MVENQRGRQKKPFLESVKALNDDAATHSAKTDARVKLVHGHTLMTLMLQLLAAHRDAPIGLATDDMPNAGTDFTQVRVRDVFLRPPVVEASFAHTHPLPIMNTSRVSGKELQAVIAATRRFQIHGGAAEKQIFSDSAIQSAVLKATNKLICVGLIGVSRHGIITTDKGPKQRLVWLFKMANGEQITIYWDIPHVESAYCNRLAKKWFPASLRIMLKVRTCAGGVHAIKIANVLMSAAKEASDDDVLDLIGPNRDVVVAELELDSCSAADMLTPFRIACKELATSLGEMHRYRWLKEDYCLIVLDGKFCILKIAAASVYAKEFGGLKPALAARTQRKTTDGVLHMSYRQDDLDALEYRVKHKVLSWIGTCFVIVLRFKQIAAPRSVCCRVGSLSDGSRKSSCCRVNLCACSQLLCFAKF